MSSKTILTTVFFGLMISTAAVAEEFDLTGLAPTCDTEAAEETAAPAFNLKNGWYVPGNTSQFCPVYKLITTSHYPCNGNVRSLTLSCEGRAYGFTCSAGRCVTSDGGRELQIPSGCNDRAHYRSSENRTVLYYDGPCR